MTTNKMVNYSALASEVVCLHFHGPVEVKSRQPPRDTQNPVCFDF
jgi:hypothetical protein